MSDAAAATWREIPEHAADASLRALYAEIQDCLKTQHVPTLYRVVAAHGYLEEFWRLLKPLLTSPQADRFVAEAREIGIGLARQIPASPVVLSKEVAPNVIEILESFNRGNPRNFLFSTAGRRLLDFEATPQPTTWQLAAEAREETGDDLAAVWQDIREAHGSAAIPGFYRALGAWPDALKSLWDAARPLLTTTELDLARSSLTAACRQIVDSYPLQRASRLPTSGELAAMLEWFVWANPTAILEIEYLRAHIAATDFES